jgi:hypothetical protein
MRGDVEWRVRTCGARVPGWRRSAADVAQGCTSASIPGPYTVCKGSNGMMECQKGPMGCVIAWEPLPSQCCPAAAGAPHL